MGGISQWFYRIMILGRLKSAQFTRKIVVLLMPLVAFALSAYFRFGTHLIPNYTSDVDPFPYFGLLLLTTFIWAIVADHYELASTEIHLLSNGKFRRVVKACLATYIAVLAITFFYRDTTFSRMFIWLSAANLFLFTVFAQMIFSWVWAGDKSRHKTRFNILIVGTDEFAARVAESLLSDSLVPCSIQGHVRVPHQVSAIENGRIYELLDIETLAIGNAIDDVIIAIPPNLLGQLRELRRQLSPLCVPVRLVLDLGEPVDSRQRLFTLGNLVMLDLQATPTEFTLYIIVKRAFDLLLSASVLIIAAPLLLLVAVLIRLSSAGPVIFSQQRVGLNGKLFRMYKFRTMSVSSQEQSDTRWTVRNDPRCTRIGKILRRTGIDELPQLVNVLLGDMSIVGPRPERPLLVQAFMQSVANYNRRHYLKVGITGWAQVNGWRGDTSIEKRVECDLYYLRHWTLAFDLLIVVLTLLRGFTNKNAY
jgi:Undecaprenyl-phosphate glucose phosphotransferase